MEGAEISVRLDNQDVRVTVYRLLPGARLARPRRTCDAVTLFLADGQLHDRNDDAVKIASAGSIGAPCETSIVNVGEEPIELVEIDLKWTERRLISG
jgi:hypothetical protein